MGNTRSYYEVLCVAPEATQEDIARAYKRLIVSLRAKISAGNPPPSEMFGELETAFRTLRDPQLRATYDSERPNAPPPSVPPLPPFSARDDGAVLEARQLRFAFHGNGGEYFRIWIVNLLLSIVTLGIYSAWAKVRREQYFHRNLTLDGAGFDYHASPIAILKGRIIAVVLLAAYSFTRYGHPFIH